MRRRAKSGLKKTKKHAIVFIEVMECHGQPIKKNALRLVTAGRSFAVGSAASTVCHMRCSPLPPQQSKDQRPQDTSQNTDQERYDKVIEHHETPSLPCRIGLVGRGSFSITQRTTKLPLRCQPQWEFSYENLCPHEIAVGFHAPDLVRRACVRGKAFNIAGIAHLIECECLRL